MGTRSYRTGWLSAPVDLNCLKPLGMVLVVVQEAGSEPGLSVVLQGAL